MQEGRSLELVDFLLSLCRPARLFRWTTFFLALVLLWVALNYTTLQNYFAAREQRNGYRESVANLKTEKKKLRRHLGDLESGGFQVEKTIRERLKMVRPGEKIIFIQPPVPPAKREPGKQEPKQANPAGIKSEADGPIHR